MLELPWMLLCGPSIRHQHPPGVDYDGPRACSVPVSESVFRWKHYLGDHEFRGVGLYQRTKVARLHNRQPCEPSGGRAAETVFDLAKMRLRASISRPVSIFCGDQRFERACNGNSLGFDPANPFTEQTYWFGLFFPIVPFPFDGLVVLRGVRRMKAPACEAFSDAPVSKPVKHAY